MIGLWSGADGCTVLDTMLFANVCGSKLPICLRARQVWSEKWSYRGYSSYSSWSLDQMSYKLQLRLVHRRLDFDGLWIAIHVQCTS